MPKLDILISSGKWAVSRDAAQWTLLHRDGSKWNPQSFVSSSRDILARVMRERGVPETDRDALLSALPERFAVASPVEVV